MADDKITISIELDDGKIIHGLAKVESGVKKTSKEAKGLGEDIENAFSGTAIGDATSRVNGFISKIKSIPPPLLAVTTVLIGVSAAFERALAGEKIEAINNQFELLSNQVGASVGELRAGLDLASGGIVDIKDVLSSANKFLIEFGNNANRLPEVLDLARKSTALFGGDVTKNFEQIAQAIASGQTRSLKSLGIIIDQESAYKRFAESIGVAVGALNDAGKKQAILDEVLRKGGETFKNVDPNINQLSTSVKKLSIQFEELFDAVAVKSNKTFGGFFTSLINSASTTLERFNLAIKKPKDPAEELSVKLRILELDLDSLNSKIKSNNILLAQSGGINQDALSQANENLIKKRKAIQDEINALQQSAASQQSTAPTQDSSVFVDTAKVQENLAKLNSLFLTAKQQRITAESALDLSEEERRQMLGERIVLSQQNLQFRLAEIDRMAREQGLLNTQTYQDLKNEIIRAGELEQQKIIADSQAQNSTVVRITAQQINQGVSNAIQSTVMALKKGQNAFKAFGSSILGFIGDILIQIGTSVIGIGQAMESIRSSIAKMTGGPAIFAGIALIGLGTLLKSLSGGGDAGVGQPTGVNTGIVPGGEPFDPTKIESEPQKPTTQVAINIQGDVLDSRDSGMRIVDLIKEFTDRNGRTEVLA